MNESMVLLIEKYACGSCGKMYNNESGARGCCPNRAEERWVCLICGQEFWDEGEGKIHVVTPHGNSDLDPDQKYLELLFEGIPPIEAWEESHRTVTEDRKVIEEVLGL